MSFAHHSEVAALTESEQETWLERAELLGWSRNELRTALREAQRRPGAPGSQVDVERLRLQVPSAHVKRWRRAAEAGGLDLPEWIIDVADRASENEMLLPPDEATLPSPVPVPEPYSHPDELDPFALASQLRPSRERASTRSNRYPTLRLCGTVASGGQPSPPDANIDD